MKIVLSTTMRGQKKSWSVELWYYSKINHSPSCTVKGVKSARSSHAVLDRLCDYFYCLSVVWNTFHNFELFFFHVMYESQSNIFEWKKKKNYRNFPLSVSFLHNIDECQNCTGLCFYDSKALMNASRGCDNIRMVYMWKVLARVNCYVIHAS